MWRKLLFVVMGLICAAFIYFMYFKSDTLPSFTKEKSDVATVNIRYNIADKYRIEADNSRENQKSNIMLFENARVYFSGMRVKGREALLDSQKNMEIKKNVFGENKNGLSFRTETVKYNRNAALFESPTRTKVVNKNTNTKIEADRFNAPESLSMLSMNGNVKLDYGDMTVNCDTMNYNKDLETVDFFGNIRFKGKNIRTETAIVGNMSGKAENGFYDMKNENLRVWGNVTSVYKGYDLSADTLVFDKKTGRLYVYGNVRIQKGQALITGDNGEYNEDTKIFTITGNFKYTSGKTTATAAQCQFYTENDNMILTGNPVIKNNKYTMEGDVITYKSDDGKIYAKGSQSKKALIYNDKYKLETDEAFFSEGDSSVRADGSFTLDYDKETKIRGTNLNFNIDKNNGKFANAVVSRGKNYIRSDLAEFEMDTSEITFINKVKAVYDNYRFDSDRAHLDGNTDIISTDSNFTVYTSKNEEISGTGGIFDNALEKVTIKKNTMYNDKDYTAKSEKLFYDMKKEKGYFENNVELKRKSDKTIVKCERADFDMDDKVSITGAFTGENKETKLTSRDAVYDMKNKKVSLPHDGVIDAEKENSKNWFDTAVYDEAKGELLMTKFKGIKNDLYKGRKQVIDFSSQTARYDDNTGIFYMKGDVRINYDTFTVKTQECAFNNETGDIIPTGETEIEEKKMKVIAQKSKINIKRKTINGTEVTVTTEDGDLLKGDKLDGDYEKHEMNFYDNLDADLSDGTKFSGDKAKMYFKEDETSEYKITRGEVLSNVTFKTSDMVMKGEFIEIDNLKQVVYGRNKPKLSIGTETECTADYMFIDLKTEDGKMENNVAIVHKNDKVGTVNSKSDRATLRNKDKLIELDGHIVAYQNKNKIEADKGIMDLKTGELEGVGNTTFKYNFEKKGDKKK